MGFFGGGDEVGDVVGGGREGGDEGVFETLGEGWLVHACERCCLVFFIVSVVRRVLDVISAAVDLKDGLFHPNVNPAFQRSNLFKLNHLHLHPQYITWQLWPATRRQTARRVKPVIRTAPRVKVGVARTTKLAMPVQAS